MAENENENEGTGRNEGEGNRTADRRYREGVEKTVREGHFEEDANRARREVEEDPGQFRRAEEEARRRSAGDLPGDLEKK